MLGVVSCSFNPANFKRPIDNWYAYRQGLREIERRPFFGIELEFGLQKTDADLVVESNENMILWQKEAMLAEAIKRLPKEVTKVAWIDADFVTNDKDWFTKTEEALDEFPLVQMFSTVVELDKNQNIAQIREGQIASGGKKNTRPGGAWAARREIFDDCDMYSHCIAGSGDCALLSAAKGNFNPFWTRRISRKHKMHWFKWAWHFHKKIRGYIGFADTQLTHLYHGSQANRQYVSRDQILSDLKYDPEIHVRFNDDNLLEWTDAVHDKTKNEMRDFFRSRKEDA